ncbi:MAG: hypothetical protein JWO13_2491 [Acidobacteriales bacterium]|nr:hypothetical protein [Terriglobales bacterium]
MYRFLLAIFLVVGACLVPGCGGGGGGTAPTKSFIPPVTLTIASVSPTSGPQAGGTSITITGTALPSNATVTFGGTAATSIVVAPDGLSATVVTPGHTPAGAVDVVVTDPTSNTTVTLTGGFTYSAAPPPANPLSITTAVALPDATLGVAYSQTLAATGGNGTAKQWSVTTGSLPTGLILQPTTGIISGAATQSGTATFTVQVQDTSGNATKQFTLNVTNVLPGGQIALVDCTTTLTQAGKIYQLQNDISATGTCLSVQAANVTIDLNGHTLTYATAPAPASPVPTPAATAGPTQHRHGILGIACFDFDLQGNPCIPNGTPTNVSNLTIAGNLTNPGVKGKIVQGAGAGFFSHAIRLGQSGNISGLVVHDVDITISAQNSFAIYSNFSTGGASIYNNVIHNNVTTITNRQNFDGMSIKLDNEIAATVPNSIHDNVIIGGAQGAIRETNAAGTKIFNNDISMNATYSNDFCIDAPGSNIEIYGNNCHPTQGRGFHLNGNNLNVHDNIVDVIEKSTNQEYGAAIASITRTSNVVTVVLASPVAQSIGNNIVISGTSGFDGSFQVASAPTSTTFTYNDVGPDATASPGAGSNATGCQLNGVYGIQVESDLFPSGKIDVFNNTVTARAGECTATALKMTNISSTSILNIHDNTFTAKRIGSTTKNAQGSSMEIFNGINSTLDHNTFVVDTSAMHVDFLGASNLNYTNSTFAKGSNPAANWFLTDFGNTFGGGASTNNVFLDSIYQNGASDSFSSITKSTASEEFFINWTVILKVVDNSHAGIAVPNANVTIKDSTGATVFTGATAANGTVSAVLTQRHVKNSTTLNIVPPDPLTPHSITIVPPAGCTPNPDTFSLTVNAANLPAPGTPIVHGLATCP